MAAVFNETDDNTAFEKAGLYADMYSPAFDTVTKIRLEPDENGLWFDYGRIEDETLRVIGTGARIFSLEDEGNRISVRFRGADSVRLNIRLRVPYRVNCSDSRFECSCDELSRTVLISYDSCGGEISLALDKIGEWQ